MLTEHGLCDNCGQLKPLRRMSGFTFCHPEVSPDKWCAQCADRIIKPRIAAAIRPCPPCDRLHRKNTLKGRDPITQDEIERLWGSPDIVLTPSDRIHNWHRKDGGIAIVYWIFLTEQAPGGCIVCGLYKHGWYVNPHKQMGWSSVIEYLAGQSYASTHARIEMAGFTGTLITTSGARRYAPLLFNAWCPSRKVLIQLHPERNGVPVTPEGLAGLPEKPGCYALISGRKVLYVGQSFNIRKRLRAHHKIRLNEAKEEWRLHFWLERDPMGLEGMLIKFLRPQWNVAGRSEMFPKLCGWSPSCTYREDIK